MQACLKSVARMEISGGRADNTNSGIARWRVHDRTRQFHGCPFAPGGRRERFVQSNFNAGAANYIDGTGSRNRFC